MVKSRYRRLRPAIIISREAKKRRWQAAKLASERELYQRRAWDDVLLMAYRHFVEI